jgi:hypothetical protein
VLVCLVAAVVTLSSFGIFKGGGSGRGDEPWETRSEAFPSSDALERSARSFGDRATTDFGSDDRFATDRVGEGDGTDVRDSVSIDEIVQDRPATRPNAPVITNAVVDRTPIATITSEASDSLSEAAADELKRLKASHEHVGKKQPPTFRFSRGAPGRRRTFPPSPLKKRKTPSAGSEPKNPTVSIRPISSPRTRPCGSVRYQNTY